MKITVTAIIAILVGLLIGTNLKFIEYIRVQQNQYEFIRDTFNDCGATTTKMYVIKQDFGGNEVYGYACENFDFNLINI